MFVLVRCFWLAGLLLSGAALAQPAVVEGSVDGQVTAQGAGQAAGAAANQAQGASTQSELFYQLQLLQEEVMQLRGMLEEQQFEIRKLKQQRLDDYLSLDQRISALGAAPAAGSPAGKPAAAAPAAVNLAAAAQMPQASAEETAAYKAAYELVKGQKFADARAAFQAFLQKFPDNTYTPNAYYWLGELYLIAPDLEAAREAFSKLIANYPDHRKIPDARFKLAKVYHQLGDDAKAKAALKSLIADYGSAGGSAVNLAKDYYRQHFE